MKKEKIPYSIISQYHCDDIQWDETSNCYALLDIDPWYDDFGRCHVGYDIVGYASYEEIQCAISQWIDVMDDEYYAELQAAYAETLISLRNYN